MQLSPGLVCGKVRKPGDPSMHSCICIVRLTNVGTVEWFAVEEQTQKIKKRLRAIRREVQAVEDGLKSVKAEDDLQDADQQPADMSMQHSGQRQGDLQRATMLERLSALEAKQTQLQVSCACCTAYIEQKGNCAGKQAADAAAYLSAAVWQDLPAWTNLKSCAPTFTENDGFLFLMIMLCTQLQNSKRCCMTSSSSRYLCLLGRLL